HEKFKVRCPALDMRVSETGLTVPFIFDERLPGATAIDPFLEYGYMCKRPQTGGSKPHNGCEPAVSM
ncbi:MAG: hypothetical protein WBK72_07880, partial [Bacillota bacterium]